MLEQHYLTSLFEPKSVAVIGALGTRKFGRQHHLQNILDAGYEDASMRST